MTTVPDQQPSAGEQPDLPFPLQEGETVVLQARKHWIYLWPRILLNLLFAIAPLVIVGLVANSAGLDGTGAQALGIVGLLWFLFWGIRIFFLWYSYKHDQWVVTNQRLIDCRKKNPFNLEISSADLVNVQDINVSRSGILRTVLDYGDIVCQTAGTRASFVLGGLPDPRSVQLLIDRERDRERGRYRV
jgi:hypothetical protein